MENLSQSELINTIINLSRKVDELKIQNDYLREIRLQLASLAVNNNFSSQVSNVENSASITDKNICKCEGHLESISLSDDLYSTSNSIKSEDKLNNNQHDLKKKSVYFTDTLSDHIITEEASKILNLDPKYEKLQIRNSYCELELFRVLKKIHQFVHLRNCIIYHYSFFYFIPNVFNVPLYFCESIEHFISCTYVYNSVLCHGYFPSINNFEKPILPIETEECIPTLEKIKYCKKASSQWTFNSCVIYLLWCSHEIRKSTSMEIVTKMLPERSFGDNYISLCLQTSGEMSSFAYSMLSNYSAALKVIKKAYLLKLLLKPKSNTIKYKMLIENPKKCTKSVSKPVKRSKIRHIKKTLINPKSNIPNKISLHKKDVTLRRSNSFSNIKSKDSNDRLRNFRGDFSENESCKSASFNHIVPEILCTPSRKMWQEKCQLSNSILLQTITSEIICYTAFLISMSSNKRFKCDFENIANLIEYDMERKKNKILQSQLGLLEKDNLEQNVDVKTVRNNNVIKLNSLNVLESNLSKNKLSHSMLQNNKNLYDFKKVIKSNISSNGERGEKTSSSNQSACSQYHLQKMINMDPNMFRNVINEKSDSSSTVAQQFKHRMNKLKYTRSDDSAENKFSFSNYDNLFFVDNDQIISNISKSEGSFNNDLRYDRDSYDTSSKYLLSHKEIKENSTFKIQSDIAGQDSKKLKMDDRKSKLKIRKYALYLNDSQQKCSQKKREYENQKNKISILKHLNELSRGDLSKSNSLRKKAASFILNSRMNYNSWKKKTSSGTSAQIRHFLDTEVQDMMSNKHYYCDQCYISFKLGTELRQHLRSHNFHKKTCVI